MVQSKAPFFVVTSPEDAATILGNKKKNTLFLFESEEKIKKMLKIMTRRKKRCKERVAGKRNKEKAEFGWSR